MWKNIEGFEGLYLINENGDILNLKTNKVMTPYISNKGYKMVDLSKNGTKYKYLVHRLVALHFIENPNNYPIVLHIDNVKTNTNYTNLKWGTYSQNNSQAIRDGLNIVPKPDNRKFFEIYNDEETKCIAYGINELKKIIQYNHTDNGLYSMIHRNSAIDNGEYIGCRIRQMKLIPAITLANKPR